MSLAHFNFPTSIDFGLGAIKTLSSVLSNKGVKNPCVVTDKSIAELEFLKSILQDLTGFGITPHLYAATEGNPLASYVNRGVEHYKARRCDSVVAIGGGAALDVAKAISLLATNPGTLYDYEDFREGSLSAINPLPFTVAVPTTAGTGSEVGRSSVISDDETKQKKIIFDPQMLPDHVIADPELTFTLPPPVTAATGMDALTHNIEAYLARNYHPMCSGIALEGIRLISRSLLRAYQEPNHAEARSDMLMASLMGAVAFQKGLGVTHSCAHALSTVFDLHHGLANALMLRASMQFNYAAVPKRLDDVCHALGIAPGSESLSCWIDEVNKDLGLPSGLSEIKVEIDERLIDVAFSDPIHPSNPRPVSREDFRDIFTASL